MTWSETTWHGVFTNNNNENVNKAAMRKKKTQKDHAKAMQCNARDSRTSWRQKPLEHQSHSVPPSLPLSFLPALLNVTLGSLTTIAHTYTLAGWSCLGKRRVHPGDLSLGLQLQDPFFTNPLSTFYIWFLDEHAYSLPFLWLDTTPRQWQSCETFLLTRNRARHLW